MGKIYTYCVLFLAFVALLAHANNQIRDSIRNCLSQRFPHLTDTLPFFGASTSSHQVESCNTNNTYYILEKSGNPHYPHIKEEAGIACGQHNHFQDDIALMAKNGLTWHRFSIEWAKVEPRPGKWDMQAIAYYQNFVKELLKHNIEPIVNLHHYTDPVWLALEGGFAAQSTVQKFAQFAAKMAHELPEVTYWSTFNSPAGFTSRIYLSNNGAPTDLRFVGKKTIQAYTKRAQEDLSAANDMIAQIFKDYCPQKNDISGAALALCNVMQAHGAAYHAIKAVNSNSRIGILQNIHQLDPFYCWDPLAKLASYINEELNHRSVHRALTEGIFRVFIPIPVIGCWISQRVTSVCNTLEWVGLNYYSNRKMIKTSTYQDPNDIPTDNPNYIVYPEGIYRALKQIHTEVAKPLDIPILITENGIATNDDQLREQFVLDYGYQICRAIEEGIPVQAWCMWSLLDNYEWGSFDKNYGLVHVDRKTLKRTEKPILSTIKTLSTPLLPS